MRLPQLQGSIFTLQENYDETHPIKNRQRITKNSCKAGIHHDRSHIRPCGCNVRIIPAG